MERLQEPQDQDSGNKNCDLMKFKGKWMGTRKIIRSKVIQTQKDKYNMYSPIGGYISTKG